MEAYINSLMVTFFQLLYVSILIERAVTNFKNLKRVTYWYAPPVVATVLALLASYMFNLRAIEAGIQGTQSFNDIWFLKARFVDTVITGFVLGGGAAGLVDVLVKLRERGDALTNAKISKISNGS